MTVGEDVVADEGCLMPGGGVQMTEIEVVGEILACEIYGRGRDVDAGYVGGVGFREERVQEKRDATCAGAEVEDV